MTEIKNRGVTDVCMVTPATWYAPVDLMFPNYLDLDWATNDEHSPPVDRLLVCADETGATWLVLEGEYHWSQPQYPDDAAVGTPHH